MFDNSLHIFLAFFGGYAFMSMVLLRNPTLLHRKKNIKFTCRHISHRGGAGENYENTLTAFKRAVAIGTDMLELDCQLTKDNQVVVCHDSNLFRSTGVNKNISELNYRELPLLKPSLPIDFDPGVMFKGSGIEEERRIPLLSEVFKHFPTVPINIDVKSNNDLLVKEVNRLITHYGRENITVWGSFSESITLKCYAQNPNVNLLFSLKQVIRLILLYYTGLLPFFPIKESHLEIFQPSMYLRPAWKINTTRKEGHFMIFWPSVLIQIVDALLMSKTLFQHLKKRGIQTYVWVLNYENEFKQVYDLEVTGIMTDYPTRLKKFLNSHHEYSCAKNVIANTN
ncbi:lysophospholipase D GDPD1-like [Rhodnius prolixus]|uniref:Putative glycerophosphoryl diester phosphodiesterase n=1 Tax=Rhodnius prolixus TaxID=13249 RepID=R4FMM7_RHOPR